MSGNIWDKVTPDMTIEEIEKLFADAGVVPVKPGEIDPKQAYEEICKNGFKNRMLFGTDFPLTHWFHKGECLDNEMNFENLQTEYQLAIKENCGSPKLS